MDVETFKAQVAAAGYPEPEAGGLKPGHLNSHMHTHDFDAMIMVTRGEITIGRDEGTTTFKAGDWCEVLKGTMHTEAVGPEGVQYLFAKRS
jgi:mannose-6-phosphate isomerase-like protein (cupin superfamily)